MDLLTQLSGNFANGLIILIAFLFALTIVVFVHEMGHFLVARWCGVGVQTFSIGFGREIWAFEDNHGTRWRIAWIPLGGYVKFADDDNVASAPSPETIEAMTPEQRQRSFHLKPVWQRAAVVAAGPLANFILAILIFAIVFMTVGVVKLEPRVSEVDPGSPAAEAGFKPGDLVLSIDDEKIEGFSDLQRIVSTNVGRSLTFVVEREGAEQILTATPRLKELDDPIAGKHSRPIIGIKTSRDEKSVTHTYVDPLTAIWLGTRRTWDICVGILSYIGDIFTGRQSAEQIGGVVRIADAAGKLASIGFMPLVAFTAFISVSIGLINLFPIPVLDGGHLVFYSIEAIRGRPLSENAQEVSFRIGFALILMLIIFGLYNDRTILARWFSWPV